MHVAIAGAQLISDIGPARKGLAAGTAAGTAAAGTAAVASGVAATAGLVVTGKLVAIVGAPWRGRVAGVVVVSVGNSGNPPAPVAAPSTSVAPVALAVDLPS